MIFLMNINQIDIWSWKSMILWKIGKKIKKVILFLQLMIFHFIFSHSYFFFNWVFNFKFFVIIELLHYMDSQEYIWIEFLTNHVYVLTERELFIIIKLINCDFLNDFSYSAIYYILWNCNFLCLYIRSHHLSMK